MRERLRAVRADDYEEPLRTLILRGEIEPPDELVMEDRPTRKIVVLRCPSCGYAEIVHDGRTRERYLSDDWCGHDRDRFVRERYVAA